MLQKLNWAQAYIFLIKFFNNFLHFVSTIRLCVYTSVPRGQQLVFSDETLPSTGIYATQSQWAVDFPMP